jgi:hypothetical protein
MYVPFWNYQSNLRVCIQAIGDQELVIGRFKVMGGMEGRGRLKTRDSRRSGVGYRLY